MSSPEFPQSFAELLNAILDDEDPHLMVQAPPEEWVRHDLHGWLHFFKSNFGPFIVECIQRSNIAEVLWGPLADDDPETEVTVKGDCGYHTEGENGKRTMTVDIVKGDNVAMRISVEMTPFAG